MDMAICAKQLADEGKTVDEIFAALEEKQIILFRSFIQITLNNFHVVEDYHQWQSEWHRC